MSKNNMKHEADAFFAGVCVSLQIVKNHGYATLWGEIVKSVGVDALMQYAAHVEKDEWELAGFRKYVKTELHLVKPRKRPNAKDKTAGASATHIHPPVNKRKTTV